jgi:hypothetical protein
MLGEDLGCLTGIMDQIFTAFTFSTNLIIDLEYF